MQNQNVVHIIDGKSYEFYMMPPSRALRILVQIVKRSLGPVGGALDGSGASLAEILKARINLNGFLSRLAENLDEDWAQQTIMALLEHVLHQGGSKIVFEVEFQGKLFHMLKIVGKALEVNYADFWEGLRATLASAPGPEQSKE